MLATHTDISFTVSAAVVTFIVSYIIPLITAIITKVNASATLKQIITAILSALTGLITAATTIDGEAFFSQESLVLALGTFLLSQAAYLGLYKPHDASAKILPDKGLG